MGEDGSGAGLQATGFEFGVDPNEDPELALVRYRLAMKLMLVELLIVTV